MVNGSQVLNMESKKYGVKELGKKFRKLGRGVKDRRTLNIKKGPTPWPC